MLAVALKSWQEKKWKNNFDIVQFFVDLVQAKRVSKIEHEARKQRDETWNGL